MKRSLAIGAATVMLVEAAFAGTPRPLSAGDGDVVPLTTCTIRMSATGLTVGDEYAFVLTASGSAESVTYTVQVKAEAETFQSRDIRFEMVRGTTMALSGRNLSDPEAPELVGAIKEACKDPVPGSSRSPRG
jgi:hypothetical protein